jgi:copper resistance protein C
MKTLHGFLVVMVVMFTSINLAAAHTNVARTLPNGGGMISGAPSKLEILFKLGARITALKIYKVNGGEISLGRPAKMANSRLYRGKLPKLEAGKYRVEWRAMAEDGHMMNGRFSFSVKGQ